MVSAPVASNATTASPNGSSHGNRSIRKVAVLGAGIMGSRIALHFANIGVEALLLDIAPKELLPEEQAKGLTLDHPAVKNRIVSKLFADAVKGSPSPVYDKNVQQRVTTGNFTDDLAKVADVDWIIEVIVENLDIKKGLYEKLDALRKPGTLITSNTSSIPIHLMAEGRSADFKAHFCGTHFFNPPRYLRLLEIIPTADTKQEVIDFLMLYGDLQLGKTTVLCKDTPGFIANRIGIFSFAQVFQLVTKYGLTVEEVDELTGPLTGRAKSATFRTSDIVGLDTTLNVSKVLYDKAPNDERRDVFLVPDYVKQMAEKKMLGDKTGGGFFKKQKTADGGSEILSLNLSTLAYVPQVKPRSESLKAAKQKEALPDKLRSIVGASDKYGEFLRELHYAIFAYCSNRIPEIADELYRLDQAVSAGFNFSYGPFELWDILGVKEFNEQAKAAGYPTAAWVDELLAAGHTSFYKLEKGRKLYYDVASKSYKPMPRPEAFVILDDIRSERTVWSNAESALIDLGDGIVNFEFRSKMNSLGPDVLMGLHQALDIAESKYRGLVISNQGENFSAGANIGVILMMAMSGAWDQLEEGVKVFQNTSMRIRYSSIPVVLGVHGLTLGGGCEFSMHADSTIATAETYMGLVEAGIGLLPGGGGTKELAVRISDEYMPGDVEINTFQKYFMNAAMAKVATSGAETFELGLLTRSKDRLQLNKDRLIGDAKRRALELAEAGYVARSPRKDIRVMGRAGMAAVWVATHTMLSGNYISEHDKLIAEKIGTVICGGDLSAPQTVSEQYLLDLERECFLSLAGTEKTIARVQHMLQTGKPLRN